MKKLLSAVSDATSAAGRLAAASVLLAALFGAHDARAQAADADFFKGKTVRLIVGVAPGGGYDAHARMLAPLLEKQIGATVLVENRPGAAGMAALNSLVKDTPDGLRLMLLNGEGAVLAKIIDQPNMNFDLSTIGYLGRVSYENRVLLASRSSPFSKIEGFTGAKSPVMFGSGGRIDGMGETASILCRALNIPCKLVTGYEGSAQVTLAVVRGELHAQITAESQVAKMVKAENLVAVAVLGPNRAPLLPEAPTIFEAARLTPEQAKWITFRSGISDIGRSLVVPPNVPEARRMVYETAFRNILTDPQVIAAAEKSNRPISYAPPADTRKIIDGIFSKLTAAERAEIRDLILKAY